MNNPLIFVHNSLPIGGAEQLRLAVCRELLTRGIPFRICALECAGAIGEELQDLGVYVDVLGTKQWVSDVRVWFRLHAYFTKHQPAIVQSSLFEANTHCRLVAPCAGVPVLLCEEHSLDFRRNYFRNKLDYFLQNRSDVVLTVSRAVHDYMKLSTKISPEHLKVLHNCVDPVPFMESSEPCLRSSLGIAEDTFVIGHVGSLKEEKGHKVLFRAFQQFRREQEAKLLLIGDGPMKQELEAYASKLGIHQDVIFAGIRRDMQASFKSMDVFAFPSVCEALGIALQEAMLMGLPVIASDQGGMPELIKSGEDGFLFPVGDADGLAKLLLKLYHNKALRFQLGEKARTKILQEYLPEQYVNHLFEIYREVHLRKKLPLPYWLRSL